jgi:hypothetical protein
LHVEKQILVTAGVNEAEAFFRELLNRAFCHFYYFLKISCDACLKNKLA